MDLIRQMIKHQTTQRESIANILLEIDTQSIQTSMYISEVH